MIVLVGESASGKTSIEKELVRKFGYEKILTHTTRSIRAGEKEGVDYHFCGNAEFGCREKSGEYLSVSVYNGWRYGIPKVIDDDIADRSVLVAAPAVLRRLQKEKFKNLRSFYINVPRSDRLIMSLKRGDDVEEVYRRNLTEVGQFDGVDKECNYTVSNQLDQIKTTYAYSAYELAKIINELYKTSK